MLASPGNVVMISELPVIGKADGQFLENLVYLRSTVVVDSAALPRELITRSCVRCTMIAAASRRLSHWFAAPAGFERLFVD
jgi:hypothetical protein